MQHFFEKFQLRRVSVYAIKPETEREAMSDSEMLAKDAK
ncbi:hypothetical protein J2782_004079 [Brucella pseudogrignonensis]|uniref:Uncharacterized protein n=1 Tax=Brucella pseudogrignonensis TaxID=419475 RepID=A0ABU1MEI9_9HYPH|nr:hypothetical protein [Brucella pseudogrignonensis]